MCLWIERINIIKIELIPSDLQIRWIPFQNPRCIFGRSGKTHPKIKMDLPGPPVIQKKKKKEEEGGAGALILPDSQTYCRIIILKAVWYLHKDRHID